MNRPSLEASTKFLAVESDLERQREHDRVARSARPARSLPAVGHARTAEEPRRRPPHERRAEDPDQDPTGHAAHEKHRVERQTEEAQQGDGRPELSELHVRHRVRDHDPAPLESDKRDQEPDPRGDAGAKRRGDGVHHPHAEPRG